MIGLRAARLFDGRALLPDRVVLIDGAAIAAVVEPDAVPPGVKVEVLGADSLLAPGFVDLQVNGGGGIMFNDETDLAGLRRIAAAHARAGTTTILPTLISGTREKMRQALAAAREVLAAGVPGIAGLHLEGPFISLARRGIHPEAAITSPTASDLDLLCEPFPGCLMLTVAPEAMSPSDIARLVRAGIVVFAGHTNAGFAEMQAGLEGGISGFTHLFNAMSQFTSREPGAVGAAFDHAPSHAGIIVDGYHVHPASVRIAYAAKGPEHLFLVSDAMATSASDADGFVLNGEPIRLIGGRLTNAAGTLAGAHLTMAEAVRNAVVLAGIPLEAALRMATTTPAAAARLARHQTADLVCLDRELRVTAVWQQGQGLCPWTPPRAHALGTPYSKEV